MLKELKKILVNPDERAHAPIMNDDPSEIGIQVCHGLKKHKCLDGTCVRHFLDCSACYLNDSKRCLSDAKCYALVQHCDGNKNCQDGSDEQNCPKNERWIVATVVSVFVIVFFFIIVGGFICFTRRKKQQQRIIRERQQSADSTNGRRPLMRCPRPDRLTSHLGEESQVNAGTVGVSPPFVNLYAGPPTPQGPTHMTIDFGDQSTLPSHAGRLRPSTHGASSEPHMPDRDSESERGPSQSPPPSYFDVVTNNPETAENDGLPTYEETVQADLERRIDEETVQANLERRIDEETVQADLERRIEEQESQV